MILQTDRVCKRIVSCSRAMGLTQKELARHLGVDPSTLGRWETGRGLPSRKYRARVLAFLDDSPSVDKEM